MKSENITIIVNTCDGFEDCWIPFFTLLKTYWPSCSTKILLTTYKKNFTFEGLDIECLLSSKNYSSELQWSDNLLMALDEYVKTDLVLLMLDDFFISSKVDEATIEKCSKLMIENNFSNITLSNHDTKRKFHKTANPLILRIDQKSPYRVTTSPALWKRTSLKKYLRKNENIWMFEMFGTKRSFKIKDSFFRINESRITEGFDEVIPYFQGVDDTGIVKGKWQKGVEGVFEKAGIEVDYSLRGFYHKLPGFINKYYLAKNLIKNPKIFYKGILGK